jgi:hypothetical protein
MFDVKNYYQNKHTSSYSKVDITEKKAPTDESLKLLKEMEEKTLNRIVDRHLVNGNGLEIIGITLENHAWRDEVDYVYGFRLNGRLYSGKIQVGKATLYSKEEVIEKVYQNLSQVIASKLIEKTLTTEGVEGL